MDRIMKVTIIGRTQILYDTALELYNLGHTIQCIITAKAAPEYTRNEHDFRILAKKVGASFFLTKTLNNTEIEEACQGSDIGISVNWISVLNKQHLSLFKFGILNSHFGDLPKYRGNATPNWAIIRNEEKITNTIHFMEDGSLDCGRVIHQEHFNLDCNSTISDVYQWAEDTIPNSFVSALRAIEADNSFSLKYANPNNPLSFRCYPRLPEDGYIQWDKPVLEIHNIIRAAGDPFSGAYCYHRFEGEVKKLFILKSEIISTSNSDIAVPGHVLKNNSETGDSQVQCGEGIIAIQRCKYDGENDDFLPGRRWKSIRMRLEVRIEDWLWEIKNTTMKE